jgi:hypothetical protein
MTQKGNDIIALVTGGVLEKADAAAPIVAAAGTFDAAAALEAANDLIDSVFGETITVTDAGGTATSMVAVVTGPESEVSFEDNGRFLDEVIYADISTDQLISPMETTTITRGGKTFRMERWSRSNNLWRIRATRSEKIEMITSESRRRP